jgi:hypothetical protein
MEPWSTTGHGMKKPGLKWAVRTVVDFNELNFQTLEKIVTRKKR